MDAASVHGLASLALLALGTAIAVRPKTRRAGHPVLGRLYAAAMLPSLALAMLAGARDPAITVFEVITPPLTVGLLVGWWAGTAGGRRRLGAAWVRVHASGMGGSLIGLYSAGTIQVVQRLAGDDTPLLTLAFLPTIIGSPIIAAAIARRAPRRAAPSASTA